MNSILFWAHMLLVPVFGYSQCHKMLVSTQGVSISMFVLAATFAVLQTWLAISAYRNRPTWATTQVLIVYIAGIIVYSSMIAIAFLKGSYVWRESDTLATIIASIGTAIVVGIGRSHNLPWYDPIIKGWINVPVRAVPNLVMGYMIWTHGGNGVSATFVVTMNMLTIMRIAQVILTSIKLKEWDRNRTGLIIGEIANELSWLITTIIWILV